MKNYNLIPQEKNNYCVCSVVQAIFESHGIKMSQDEIALRLNPSKHGYTINDLKFRNFLQENNFKYDLYSYNATPFNEPDSLLNSLGDKFLTLKNHVVLVNNFEDPQINFIDPANNELKREKLENILGIMNKANLGFFGVLRKI